MALERENHRPAVLLWDFLFRILLWRLLQYTHTPVQRMVRRMIMALGIIYEPPRRDLPDAHRGHSRTGCVAATEGFPTGRLRPMQQEMSQRSSDHDTTMTILFCGVFLGLVAHTHVCVSKTLQACVFGAEGWRESRTKSGFPQVSPVECKPKVRWVLTQHPKEVTWSWRHLLPLPHTSRTK